MILTWPWLRGAIEIDAKSIGKTGKQRFELAQKLPPAEPGAMEGLVLVGPEARLLHAQLRAGMGRRQRPGDDAFEPMCFPRIGKPPVGFDLAHGAIDAHPGGSEAEGVAEGGREIALHQPFGEEVRLRQGPPQLFRRMGKIALDDNGAYLGLGVGHGYLLRLCATAAWMSALKASSSKLIPSRKSTARRVAPPRLELNSFAGSGRTAPLAKVVFTAAL